MKDISYAALLAAFLFMLIPFWLSYKQKLGISKEMMTASVRAFVQLTVIGYIITFVFSIENPVLFLFIIFIMIVIASRTSAKRGEAFERSLWIAFAALVAAEAASVVIWVTFDIVDFEAQYILPMSGMIIGSSMVAVSLVFDRLKREFDSTKELIMGKLALGATRRQASQELIEATVKAALIPSMEGMKTIGLVQLPGMMTGAIIAGASPVVAVKYQLVIALTTFGNTAITAMIVSFLTYPAFFKQRMF
ncbi:iron export ABC transporter permease subunit FetB [Domibacillus sp. DTU_2020_1001157_1_SI_ALB_TIR_016]|uniref:ABC transporter permease n=1 Tax=Domibacillus sp. DTU_2020_1001157_1_SI_ALB_TIR_016 TaxID=3077789 RepID=UPI0028EA6E33|nr:iron export ABC transporter permease subunit FetB [Domibacillus sp. DTU_2020_1001157_1_SI_ALB_TIR_016]WNS80861.1 iron export ABC transporter permease subunit FetB [Domibacillus sp. DTU_2020_1001157_1_SI_ALB_TIR_016]